MSKFLFLISSVVLIALCPGCGDSHESLTAESMSTMKKLVSVLDGVTDGATAKSAKPKLKSLMEEMESLKARQAKLGMPDEADFKAISAKYGTELEDLQKKMVGHMMRMAFDPAIRVELDDMKLGDAPG
ncbi:MAG TPA: hypothetical protein PLD59_13140 [Tepidisphaeraceae bacterium]|mgnify:CR=1 FL=1|nr:hypothetical protein [Tepidisphaeraceae bacterium]